MNKFTPRNGNGNNATVKIHQSENIIGIDLGTRFSCASIWNNKRSEVICDHFGNRTIPSVVSFYRSAKLVGYNALALKDLNPANTIYDIKRIIGRKYSDQTIDQTKKLITYDIIDDQTEHHNILVQLDKSDTFITHKKQYRPEEICSYILMELKRMAEKHLDATVSRTIITVPAYFNDSQRQATLDAGRLAGLEVIKIINEPTAAALAYGIGSRSWGEKSSGNVIVYDLGAGTLDVSLINIANGVFRTLAVGGNSHLGGEDIDYMIMSHIIHEFRREHSFEKIEMTKSSQLKLKNAVETAKKILSTAEKTLVCVDDFYAGHKIYHKLTRKKMESLCNDLFIMCIKPLDDVLTSADLKKTDIDEVILVGGSTRIPKIHELVLNFFRGTKIKTLTSSLNPDEVVSNGAAIYGYITTHNQDPFSENIVLLDVTPLSLGVETLRNQMSVIIPRNTVIPTTKTKIFSTDSDDQDSVTIKICEGERRLSKHNMHVGTFELSGFEKAPRGHASIKISFHIDINGILQVNALEKKSGVESGIRITSTWGAKGRLSKSDIDRLISESVKYEQLDNMYASKLQVYNDIDRICNNILRNIKSGLAAFADKENIKQVLAWLRTKNFTDFELSELENKRTHLKDLYPPLLLDSYHTASNYNVADNCVKSDTANVYDSDDDPLLHDYEIVNKESTNRKNNNKLTDKGKSDNIVSYSANEISALKVSIRDMCNNISAVLNSPVSNIKDDDVTIMNDYISSVHIWLYTTTANTNMEFVAKICEINQFTDDIMKKYDKVNMFKDNASFSSYDELYMVCTTIITSIKSNFFSVDGSSITHLEKILSQTLVWLDSHRNEDDSIYRMKIEEINKICNDIYCTINDTKNDPSSDVDISDEESCPVTNKINENIDNLINSFPEDNDILLKIDINRVGGHTSLKYMS